MKQKNIIAYYRKSTDAKGKGNEESVAYQQDKVHQYAQDNDLKVVKEFFEIGVSGATDNRPELMAVYRYLDECDEKIDEIVFYSIERLGRGVIVNIEILEGIIERIGKAVFIRESLSTGAENFNMLFLVYSGMAESDRENLLRNLRDGRRAKVLRYGNFDGNMPPLGYSVDTANKRLIAKKDHFINDDLSKQELEIVEEIYRSYLLGSSLRQIAKKLNECYGYTKRGCEWSYKSVQYILKNPAYIGALTGVLEGKEHYYREDSNIEVLIDPVIFSLVQKKLEFATTGRKRKTSLSTPVLMLCRFCGEVLAYMKESIQCSKCASSAQAQYIFDLVARTVKDISTKRLNHNVCTQIRDKMILQYQIKNWNMESKLSALLKRRSHIRKVEINERSKQNMQSANTQLMKDLMLENEVVKGILHFFKIIKDEDLEIALFKGAQEYFVQAPFITVIDLVDKEIGLTFIPNILKEAS